MIRKVCFTLAFFLGLSLSGNLYAEGSQSYRLHEYLSEAEVSLLRTIPASKEYRKERLKQDFARWRDGQFVFPDHPGETPIRVEKNNFEGLPYEGIFVHPTEDITKVIKFHDVSPGHRLTINYGIDDRGIAEESDGSVYMSVWVGGVKLGRLHAINEPGWKTKSFDLGAVAFLKQPLTFTFEISCDFEKGRRYSFYARVDR